MKTLALFTGRPDEVLTLKTRPDDSVATYVVFVTKWTSSGAVPVVTWHPTDLESTGGASLRLAADCRGFDLLLKAQITADATMATTIDFDGKDAFSRAVALPIVEGPVVSREWSIVMRSD